MTNSDPDTKSPTRGPFRWFCEDRATGRIVLVQFPNWPLWLFLAALVIEITVHPTGPFGLVVRIAKIAGLTIWALDEIIRGVNPWRRTLGACALVYEIVTLLRP